MNYRDTFNRFEAPRQLISLKTQACELDNKTFVELSPRLSGPDRPDRLENVKNCLAFTRSPEAFRNKARGVRELSNSKSTANNLRALDVEAENKNLKDKLETLQMERDIIRNWKRGKNDSAEYKEKLNFLVKNIQQFLQSSLKFQNMLREKLGVNVANLYEEERNLLKHQVASATKDSDIQFKYSPYNSPMRNTKSPRIDELSSIDSESSRVTEELKLERMKNRKLQSELTIELSKKDEEMRSIRDRLSELEKIEKGKIETDRLFAKASQDWHTEKKDFLKQIEKSETNNHKLKQKLNEFEQIYLDMKQDSTAIKTKCEEMIQENFKLSESLQTYDRLYNHSKKWTEKVVDEFKARHESQVFDFRNKIDAEQTRIAELLKVVAQIKEGQKEKNQLLRERQKSWSLEQEIATQQKRLKEEAGEKIRMSENYEKTLNDLKAASARIEGLEDKLKRMAESKAKYQETCEKLGQDCSKYTAELQGLYKEKSALEVELNEVQENEMDLKNSLEVKEIETERLSKKVQELNEMIQRIRNEKSELMMKRNNEVETLTEENDKLVNEVRLRDGLTQNLNKEKEKVLNCLREKEQEIDEKERIIRDMEKISKDLESRLDKKEEELKIRQASIASERNFKLEEQTKLAHFQNLDLVEKLTKKDEECADLQRNVEELRNIIKIREKSLDNLKFSLIDHETLMNNLRAKEVYIQNIENKNKSLSDNLGSKDQLIDNLKQQIDSQKNLIQEQENSLKSLEDLSKISNEKQRLAESLEKSQKQSSTLEKLLKEKNDQIKINEIKLKDLDLSLAEASKLSQKLSKLSQENSELKQTLSTLSILPQQLQEKDEELKLLQKHSKNSQESQKAIQALEEKLFKLTEDSNDKIEVLQVKVEFFTSEKEKLNLSLAEKNEQLSKFAKNLAMCQAQCELLKSEASEAQAELYKNKLKFEEYEIKLRDSSERIQTTVAEYEEAAIADKEEISRLNSALVKKEGLLSSYKKENLSLSQSITSFESMRKHCESCEKFKEKISELECLVHSAEESLGGFFINDSITESIHSLIANKTNALRKAPRPPLLRGQGQKRQSEELKPSVAEELMSKSPMLTEGSKRSHSSAFSLPDISDLRNELNEEKSENEKYLNQIKLLKEDIRELERKLKRSKEVNEKINSELLTNTLLKLVRNLPLQNTEIESMIILVFNIISIPKDVLQRLEPERRSKTSKKFGVF